MRTFVRHYILPLARKTGWQSFCEVGARDGTSTNYFLKLPLASYTVIDPCIDEDLRAKYAGDARVRVVKSNSLDALAIGGPLAPGTQFDCILIDGDHNWYTVFNELRLIRQRHLLRPGGFIFLHDVDWPYGRRDLYYQPDTIPAEFRHPFARKGIVRGRDSLVDAGGWNSQLANALHEGGARNGVMTAIEDFLAQHGNDYRFFRIRYQWGLGVLELRSRQPGNDSAFLALRAKAFVFSPISRLSRSLKLAFKGRKEG
ncbi:MAG: class I SAM-dependent methyltransferase [Terracidiphilus sp.]|jgi:SAM-dependent methyltransferase